MDYAFTVDAAGPLCHSLSGNQGQSGGACRRRTSSFAVLDRPPPIQMGGSCASHTIPQALYVDEPGAFGWTLGRAHQKTGPGQLGQSETDG